MASVFNNFQMKNLNKKFYVEIKNDVNFIQMKIIISEKPPNSLRTGNQKFDETQMKRNQKLIKNEVDELGVKAYPKKKIKQ